MPEIEHHVLKLKKAKTGSEAAKHIKAIRNICAAEEKKLLAATTPKEAHFPIRILAKAGTSEAIKALGKGIKKAQEGNDGVYIAESCVKALGKMNDPEAYSAISRVGLAQNVMHLNKKCIDELEKAKYRPAAKNIASLLKMKGLNESDKKDIIKALESLGGKNAVDGLVKYGLHDDDKGIRHYAATILGHNLKKDGGVDALFEVGLKSKEPKIVSTTAWTLTHIDDKRFLPALKKYCMNHKNPNVVIETMNALNQSNLLKKGKSREVSNVILLGLNHESQNVRMAAARHLGKLGDSKHTKKMTEIMNKSKDNLTKSSIKVAIGTIKVRESNKKKKK